MSLRSQQAAAVSLSIAGLCWPPLPHKHLIEFPFWGKSSFLHNVYLKLNDRSERVKAPNFYFPPLHAQQLVPFKWLERLLLAGINHALKAQTRLQLLCEPSYPWRRVLRLRCLPPFAAAMMTLRCRQQLAVSLLVGLCFPCCMTQTRPAPTARQPSPSPTPQAQTKPLRVRLAGHPRKHNEGRVELFHKGEWGTICDDDFSIANANVLCRQLGFVSATGWTHSAKYGKGQGRGHLQRDATKPCAASPSTALGLT